LNGRLALRHSKTRFQILFDAMPVGAMIHYQSRIVAANKPFADMFGYQQQELIGVKPVSVVAPESLEEVTRRAAEKSEESYRISGLRRNGTTFPVEVIAKEIDYQGLPMRVTVMRDLTDHLIARQRLEQMNELLEARVAVRTLELNETVADLRLALDNVQALSGLLPICGSCKKIRDDDGYWQQVEDYISAHSGAEFSHSLCPECLAKLRDEISDRQRRLSD
jgi:PAS domain S-box-containing protein